MARRQRGILLLLLGSQFMLAVDFSILNVAIPVIGAGLGFTLDSLQWIATAFAVTAAGFTLLFGRVADLVGRRRIFLAGIGLLTAASLLGGLAGSPQILIAARVLQGLATAMAAPAALSLLTTAFPEGPLRARALGLNGALLSTGFTIGAVLGGLLADLLSWRWAFLINLPVGLAILCLTPLLIGESRGVRGSRLDVPGAITVSAGLIALVYGVSAAGHRSWTDPTALVAMAAGAALLTLFWQIELRAAAPLAPVRILRRPTVVWGNFGGFVTFSMESAAVFLMTLYLQQVLGFSPLATGVSFAALGIAAFLGGLCAPRLIARRGSRSTLLAALVVQCGATVVLLLAGQEQAGLLLVLAALAVGGFGHLCAIVGYLVTATSGLPDSEQGLATGLTALTQQVAIAIGTPLMSAVATARIHSQAATHTAGEAVLGGVRLALLADAGIVAVGALLIAVFLRPASGPPAAPHR
ncbi:MFS transporter [Kitasatospora sp. NPDC057223]|uniref:MFS transporter n=1 Tax=Kitasatospora sp. NPDC057223 TaxID=3346055 RepID=UPI00363A2507